MQGIQQSSKLDLFGGTSPFDPVATEAPKATERLGQVLGHSDNEECFRVSAP